MIPTLIASATFSSDTSNTTSKTTATANCGAASTGKQRRVQILSILAERPECYGYSRRRTIRAESARRLQLFGNRGEAERGTCRSTRSRYDSSGISSRIGSKSSFSGGDGSNCVEIALLSSGRRAVPDSKDRGVGRLP
ncbi:DUF397 domain-containing protein [Sphaerisporangium sp. NPDC088356]|uniref:DUF397 domain-containing protein n=1 Tax=Sphaerisporangium sp. NPDC088356 TaxID=3154871 RepID=UPI003426AB66